MQKTTTTRIFIINKVYLCGTNVKKLSNMKKRFFLFLSTVLLSSSLYAQSATNTVSQNDTIGHMTFQNVEMGCDIDTFTQRLRPRFELKRKMGGDMYFIYHGFVFGYDTYFQAYYSKKSKTVYKVQVMPKFVNHDALVDSLSAKNGQYVLTDRGELWKNEKGLILLHSVEGSDPAILYLDSKANDLYLKEK